MPFAFRSDALFLIAGPCVLESDALNLRVGEHLAKLAERVPGGIVYKASFDKANRSNAGAARGPGLDEGLAALDRVRRSTGLPLLTDVHLPEQCAPAAEVVDVLQIPAFLCRQTDLLLAAGATGKPVNIKKGQWMHPEGMRGAVEKVRGVARGSDVAVTERGSFFGYGDLVVDMRGFSRMREACNAPVIFDDPVTSLDYERIQEVASRLAALARERQVIVFTHNIWFAVELLERFRDTRKDCSYYDIRVVDHRRGVVTGGNHPRSDTPADLKGRIKRLVTEAKKTTGEIGRASCRERV